MTQDYERHGTIDLIAALNIASGEVLYGCKTAGMRAPTPAVGRDSLRVDDFGGRPKSGQHSLERSTAPWREAVVATWREGMRPPRERRDM